jgi:hypothetical protein
MRFIILVILTMVVALMLGACSEVLEKGIIGGNVSDDDVPIAGAIVMLLDEGELLVAGAPLSNANLTGSDGNYRIYYVEPNVNYYVCAVNDVNSDLSYTPGVDQIGYYGNFLGTNWVPTPVSVSPGETLTDINIRQMI